jgi:glycosylphosphatidylinositol transamidase
VNVPITLFIEINYLSRDIIFVGFHEREYGKGISAFLEEYINPKGVSLMPRSGTIRSAININLDDRFDSIALKVFGLNGKVSDRDYFISVN